MAETTRPALEVLHEVVDAWLRRNERRAATEAAFPDAGPMVRIRFPPAQSQGTNRRWRWPKSRGSAVAGHHPSGFTRLATRLCYPRGRVVAIDL